MEGRRLAQTAPASAVQIDPPNVLLFDGGSSSGPLHLSPGASVFFFLLFLSFFLFFCMLSPGFLFLSPGFCCFLVSLPPLSSIFCIAPAVSQYLLVSNLSPSLLLLSFFFLPPLTYTLSPSCFRSALSFLDMSISVVSSAFSEPKRPFRSLFLLALFLLHSLRSLIHSLLFLFPSPLLSHSSYISSHFSLQCLSLLCFSLSVVPPLYAVFHF